MLKKLFTVLTLVALVNGQTDTKVDQIYVILGNSPSTPSFLYPNDPFNLTYWNKYGGLGKITPTGLLQSYHFGQYIKNYYSEFLTPTYNSEYLYVRSIDEDSSLQSLNSFLSGMYPPSNSEQLWSPSVSWFPIPIHTNDKETDKIFYDSCPKYDKLLTETLNGLTNFQNEFDKRLYVQYISSKTGLEKLNYYNLSNVLETNLAKLANNLEIEDWVSKELANLTKASEDRLILEYGTLEQAKLKSGGLLYDIVDNIKKKITGESTNEAYVYSCEDEHLSALTKLLGVDSKLKPLPYGSAIIIELRKNPSNTYFVQVMFKANSIDTPTELVKTQIDCNGNMLCPIFDVRIAIKDRIVESLVEECQLESPTTTTQSTTTMEAEILTSSAALSVNCPEEQDKMITTLEIVLIVVTVVLSLLVFALIVVVVKLSRRNAVLRTTF